MWKIIVIVAVILYIVYVIMAVGQSMNLIKFTNRKITVKRMLIPFYYWFASYDEKSKPKE